MQYARDLSYRLPLMRGEDVRAVQQALLALNIDPPCGSADGIYGPATAEAVRAFQRGRSLTVDGVVGPNTWNALFSSAASAPSPLVQAASQGLPHAVPGPPAKALDTNDLDILTRTLFGEARGEPEQGQVAVVHVIRNRVRRKGTSAAVECRRPRQFSCWDDSQRPKMEALATDDPIYVKLAGVAANAWDSLDITGGAEHYFAPRGMAGGRPPSWAAQGRETLRIGGHIFFAGIRW